MSVLDVTGQGGGSGTGHVTMGTLVVVNMAPHMIPQVSLYSKLLLTGWTDEGVALLLLETVIHELDSVGKQSATCWTAHQSLLAVTAHVLLQFGRRGVSSVAASPQTLNCLTC